MTNTEQLYTEALQLLQQLISTPSFSREESATADIINEFLAAHGVKTHRKMNNIWAYNLHFDAAKYQPTVEQLMALPRYHRLLIQGFLYARPQPSTLPLATALVETYLADQQSVESSAGVG